MPSADTEIGRLALEKGLITNQQLEEARRDGNGASLVNVLLDKGYLRSVDVADLIREKETPSKRDLVHEADVPEEVRLAAKYPDSRFGKYVIVKLLGTGGMGSVYRTWDSDLHRMVALKFLTSGSDDNIKRFVREARTAAQLNHPHIAQIYDAGSHEGRFYIAMELVDGVTLDELPEPVRRGEGKKLIRIFRDIALALDYAHSRGIVHRDLKPQNIMVDRSEKPHIMDFGLARPVETGPVTPEAKKQITLAGTVLGTPNYVPPEQARGDQSLVDARSDVYSLGATLYALVTGTPPHAGPTALDTLLSVLQDEPVPPSKHGPCDRDLETVILKMLEKEKSRRYQKVGEVAEELDRILAGEPILARRLGFWQKARRFLKRHPMAAAWLSSSLLFTAIALFAIRESNLVDLGPSEFEISERFRRASEALTSGRKKLRIGENALASKPQVAARSLQEALTLFAEAKTVKEVAPEALLESAHARILLEREAEALADLDSALQLKPGWWDAHFQKAVAKLTLALKKSDLSGRTLAWKDRPELAETINDLTQAAKGSAEEVQIATAITALARGEPSAQAALAKLFEADQASFDMMLLLALSEAVAGQWKECGDHAKLLVGQKRFPSAAKLLMDLSQNR